MFNVRFKPFGGLHTEITNRTQSHERPQSVPSTLDNSPPSEQNMNGEEKANLHEPKRRSRHYARISSGRQNPGMPPHRPRAAGCPAHRGSDSGLPARRHFGNP